VGFGGNVGVLVEPWKGTDSAPLPTRSTDFHDIVQSVRVWGRLHVHLTSPQAPGVRAHKSISRSQPAGSHGQCYHELTQRWRHGELGWQDWSDSVTSGSRSTGRTHELAPNIHCRTLPLGLWRQYRIGEPGLSRRFAYDTSPSSKGPHRRLAVDRSSATRRACSNELSKD